MLCLGESQVKSIFQGIFNHVIEEVGCLCSIFSSFFVTKWLHICDYERPALRLRLLGTLQSVFLWILN